MEAYIIPDWTEIVAGLMIYRRRLESQVLLGLHGDGKWYLPIGSGTIRRDISEALAFGSPATLRDPVHAIEGMSERHNQALVTPAGFALTEARRYIEFPFDVGVDQLTPLKPICRLTGKSLRVKIYFGFEWDTDELPKPAKTEWPFAEVRFFTQEELKSVPIAFGCDRDLEKVLWRWLQGKRR